MGIICRGEWFRKTRYPVKANARSGFRPGPSSVVWSCGCSWYV